MYILVRVIDQVIVGSASNPVDQREAAKQGKHVFEIDDSDFDKVMLGQILLEYKVIE